MNERVVGVIPAAGLATRLQPLDGSKELLPVLGRPVLEHLLERMRLAEPDEIRVVTRPEKHDVIEHSRRLGLTVIEGRPPTAAESIALAVEGLSANDVVLIGFPDTVWDPVDGYPRILPTLELADVVLGLFPATDDEQLRRSDVVVLGEDRNVARVEVKPEMPGSRLIWGIAAARAHSLGGLRGREHPGDLFGDLCANGMAIAAVELGGSFLDVGTPEALREIQAT